MFGHFREGQGFAAYSREARLRDPLPLGVFDTFPRLTFTCYVCTNTQHGVGLAWLIFIGLFGFPNLARLGYLRLGGVRTNLRFLGGRGYIPETLGGHSLKIF